MDPQKILDELWKEMKPHCKIQSASPRFLASPPEVDIESYCKENGIDWGNVIVLSGKSNEWVTHEYPGATSIDVIKFPGGMDYTFIFRGIGFDQDPSIAKAMVAHQLAYWVHHINNPLWIVIEKKTRNNLDTFSIAGSMVNYIQTSHSSAGWYSAFALAGKRESDALIKRLFPDGYPNVARVATACKRIGATLEDALDLDKWTEQVYNTGILSPKWKHYHTNFKMLRNKVKDKYSFKLEFA